VKGIMISQLSNCGGDGISGTIPGNFKAPKKGEGSTMVRSKHKRWVGWRGNPRKGGEGGG